MYRVLCKRTCSMYGTKMDVFIVLKDGDIHADISGLKRDGMRSAKKRYGDSAGLEKDAKSRRIKI